MYIIIFGSFLPSRSSLSNFFGFSSPSVPVPPGGAQERPPHDPAGPADNARAWQGSCRDGQVRQGSQQSQPLGSAAQPPSSSAPPPPLGCDRSDRQVDPEGASNDEVDSHDDIFN